ncbi:hypothetical protein [Epilithonimonas mollis]|uniref:Uncharacterized protein n=1 Tax=Epilithonimonas mollis TaxID=216903 RepID=A0A1M6UL44_9FLAO|nr:hypothetical protein [Epilithonimonas mollis]SHK69955.1 hypothetical protein SAMN05444371_3366 [Epilithonimonas mollis]
MAETITEKSQLKAWWVTGSKPTQAQYYLWMDAYWHKSESIPITKIEGLKTLIEGKADVEDLVHYAKVDASNIGINQGAWRTALGINDITPPDVDLSNYYTIQQVDDLLDNVTVDLTNYYTATQTESAITSKGYITGSALTGYATEIWVTTQTTPATQTEVESSTGTESQPLSTEPATENRKFLSLFNFFKLIKKLRYIHLLPNNATAVANRLRSDGNNVYYANSSAVEKRLAYIDELALPVKTITGNTTLDNTYNNSYVRITANCTITIAAGLASDLNVFFIVVGNYTATFINPSTTVYAPFGKILKQDLKCLLKATSMNNFDLIGDLIL